MLLQVENNSASFDELAHGKERRAEGVQNLENDEVGRVVLK